MKREKRQRIYTRITFTEDYATKKAGDHAHYEPSLASNLISKKVAVLFTETPVTAIKQKTNKKKNEKDT